MQTSLPASRKGGKYYDCQSDNIYGENALGSFYFWPRRFIEW